MFHLRTITRFFLVVSIGLDFRVEVGVFELHVLGHRAFCAIGLFTAGHRTDVVPLDFVGAPSHPFFTILLLLPLLLAVGCYEVGQLLFLLQGIPELTTECIILKSKLADLAGVKLECLLDVTFEFG